MELKFNNKTYELSYIDRLDIVTCFEIPSNIEEPYKFITYCHGELNDIEVIEFIKNEIINIY